MNLLFLISHLAICLKSFKQSRWIRNVFLTLQYIIFLILSNYRNLIASSKVTAWLLNSVLIRLVRETSQHHKRNVERAGNSFVFESWNRSCGLLGTHVCNLSGDLSENSSYKSYEQRYWKFEKIVINKLFIIFIFL